MPADRLTLTADQMAAQVRAVLAGTPLEQAATEVGIEPADMADALATYHAAGLAALQHGHESAWFQARVAMPDWATAETTFAARIAPRLDQLDDGKAAWWFLRKHPCWRLRIRAADHRTTEVFLDELVVAGTIDRWWPSIYEPEAAAFGGLAAMNIVHDLFCADSRGVLTYARPNPPHLGRRELSLLLVRALQQHAGLDWFEAGDVFDRIAQMRPTPADADTPRVDSLAATMRPLLTVTVQAHAPLFAPGGPAADAAPWLAAFTDAGRRLGEAATAGRLDRGLRAVLAHIVIFHWNRLGLSAEAQGVLAHAAKAAILPRS